MGAEPVAVDENAAIVYLGIHNLPPSPAKLLEA